MSFIVLRFNNSAASDLGANTRLRVKAIKRGGKEYLGLRPSYRVSGKNQMIRAIVQEDGTALAEIPEALFADEGLPELKSDSVYSFLSIGYSWFILQEQESASMAAQIAVSKSDTSIKAEDKPAQDASEQPAAEVSTQETATADTTEDGSAPADGSPASDAGDSDDGSDNESRGDAEAAEPARPRNRSRASVKPTTKEPAQESAKEAAN